MNMTMISRWMIVGLMAGALMPMLAGCAYRNYRPGRVALETVAQHDRQWAGLAVSRQGRKFVCFPRWSDKIPFSVGELLPSGAIVPYPDDPMNRWIPGVEPRDYFVSVQSLTVDNDNYLWVLDPANPYFGGVVEGGAKLVKIDLIQNKVVGNISFAPPVITENSYLNDVRIDTKRQFAYITDSGDGALIVVDLRRGRARRMLAGHPSVMSEGATLTVGGRPWMMNGAAPRVHADGITLDPDRKFLYWQALTGRTLYRIHTKYLRSEHMNDAEIAQYVQTVTQWGAMDGLAFDRDGWLYGASIEDSAIKTIYPRKRIRLVKVETLVQDERLRWPDTLAVEGDGSVYVTTTQLHLGADAETPYEILRLVPVKKIK